MTKEELLAAAAAMGLIVVENRDVEAFAKGGLSIFKGRLSDFPSHIIGAGAAYAFHKKAQDASGGEGLTGDAAAEAGRKVIEALKAGTWAAKGGGPRIVDFEGFCLSKARAEVKAWAKANEDKAKGKDLDAIAAKVAKDEARRKGWMAAWEAIQKERAAKAEAKATDIGDLVD